MFTVPAGAKLVSEREREGEGSEEAASGNKQRHPVLFKSL
jgi:hypothetical protein